MAIPSSIIGCLLEDLETSGHDGKSTDCTICEDMRSAEKWLEDNKMHPVVVQDGGGNDYVLTECECDDTHEKCKTVCRYCWDNGLRYEEPEKQPHNSLRRLQ